MFNKFKETLFNLALLFISVLVGFLVCETIIRVVPLGLPAAITLPLKIKDGAKAGKADRKLRKVLKPGIDITLATSDYTPFRLKTQSPDGSDIGFREKFNTNSAYGVVVGDSITMGWGVEYEETFPQVVQRETGKRFLNFGVGGYGPQQELLVLETFALRYKPRIVLWQFFPNDFRGAYRFDDWSRGNREASAEYKKSKLDWFTRHSSIYKLYKYATWPRSNKTAHWVGENLEFVFTYDWQKEIDLKNPDIGRGFEIYKKSLNRLQELSQEKGFTPVILIFGYKEQVYYDEFASVADGEILTLKEIERPYKMIVEHARRLGIRTLDLTRAVLIPNRDRQLYFRIDGHLNREGHILCGQKIAEYLLSEGLIE